MASIQKTFDRLKGRIADMAEEQVEERLEDLADYATRISPVDTGAYVTSFSIKRAGQGGGRSKSSDNKPRGQNPEQKRGEAYDELLIDIEALNISEMLKTGDAKIKLINRSPHVRDVENGENWQSDGYHVFARIRRKFG
jgi:hypothetical protein